MTQDEIIREFLKGCTNTLHDGAKASDCEYCLEGAVRALVVHGYANPNTARRVLVLAAGYPESYA